MIDQNIWRRLAPAMGLVTTMTGSILAGVLLGSWLDRRLGTEPLLTAGLALAGLVGGATQLSRSVRSLPPDDRPPNSDDRTEPPAP
jgi:F0F1-type ATP synthase assembly protein I